MQYIQSMVSDQVGSVKVSNYIHLDTYEFRQSSKDTLLVWSS